MDPFASALEQAAAVAGRQVDSGELVRMYLGRIEAHNPRLNHFVLTTPELALEMAERGGSGPLAGVPTSVKDLRSIAGYPTTSGSAAFRDEVLDWDAFVVSRLKAAGAPILGKTNTSEFGTRPVTEHNLHGPARNPWNPEHTTGGSSGGAGGAVAAGLCAFAHGTDGGGSVRIPASCCGVVGLKPTRGVISPGPAFGEGWAGLSTDGVLARTVADAGAGLEVMAGHLAGDPFWADIDLEPRPSPLRVGFATTAAGTAVDPEVASAVRAAAAASERFGCIVSEAAPDLSDFRAPMMIVVAAGIASLPIPASSRHLLDPINQLAIAAGEQVTAPQYLLAVAAIRASSRRVVAFWDDHDILLTPTLTRPAPRLQTMGVELATAHDEHLDWLSFTYPFNCTGQPAISLPLAMSAAGLPIGVQLVGPPRGERTILRLAAALEEALPWRHRRPPGL